jgi:hypothetical protein
MVAPDRLAAKVMVAPVAALAIAYRREPGPESAVVVTVFRTARAMLE